VEGRDFDGLERCDDEWLRTTSTTAFASLERKRRKSAKVTWPDIDESRASKSLSSAASGREHALRSRDTNWLLSSSLSRSELTQPMAPAGRGVDFWAPGRGVDFWAPGRFPTLLLTAKERAAASTQSRTMALAIEEYPLS